MRFESQSGWAWPSVNLSKPRPAYATVLLLLLFSGLFLIDSAMATSLRGSKSSMARQRNSATRHDFTYLRNESHVLQFVDRGWLVPVPGNRNYRLRGVSYPYARPEVRLFVERLASQYRSACGEQLVVTSLTRPKNRQPRNASPRSVHPTGMALDLARSSRRSCNSWLERVLLSLETRGLLEATREYLPPHYHIAVFPDPYRRYVEGRTQQRAAYTVSRGDTLWTIARDHGTTVQTLRQLNSLRTNTIRPGQVLKVPSSAR